MECSPYQPDKRRDAFLRRGQLYRHAALCRRCPADALFCMHPKLLQSAVHDDTPIPVRENDFLSISHSRGSPYCSRTAPAASGGAVMERGACRKDPEKGANFKKILTAKGIFATKIPWKSMRSRIVFPEERYRTG